MEFWTAEPRAEFAIEELPEGVRFRVRPERMLVGMVWNYVYLLFLAYLLTGFAEHGPVWARMLLVLGAGLGAGTWLNRPREITTTFEREGVRVRGALGSGARAPRWTPLSRIRDLEWLPAIHGDGDSTGRVAGLYAHARLLPVCLIPYVNAEQAARAVRAVEGRFSWVEQLPGRRDSLLFTDDLIRLDLGD